MSVIINVSRRRRDDKPPKHIFRTASDSINTRAQACAIARDLSKIYPSEEFEINVSAEAIYSEYLDWENEDGTI